jgi:p-aminobenzoyl-glutamate transporter AbgT
MGKLSHTWSLMGASWDVLRRDKKLILFPLLSGICCLIVIASFIVPAVIGGHVHKPTTQAEKVRDWVMLFCFYFANYFVITFFNAGIVACAVSRMAGGEPTVGGGFREAFKRVHLIAAWALLAATVGIILRIIEERSEKVGQIVAAVLGSAWSIMTFLVVPVLVVEDKGPIDAFKTSASLLK